MIFDVFQCSRLFSDVFSWVVTFMDNHPLCRHFFSGCPQLITDILLGGFLFGKVFDIRLCMFPSCSHCFTGLRTYFVFSVAQLLPMLVNFFGFNGNFNGKMTKIKKMAKNHFSGVQNGSQSV